MPGQVFLLARSLTDEHEVGVGTPGTEDHLGAATGELAAGAVERARGDLGEGAGACGMRRHTGLDGHRAPLADVPGDATAGRP